ncbi:MAG: RDD family protein [Alcanivorax sp.]|nr:RDD family protein [Alcanivorax sp.]
MESQSKGIIGLRWIATYLDFAVLFSFLLIPDYLLGNTVYRETLPIWLSLLVLYFPALEGFSGYTVGKYICRIKVVDCHGQAPGVWKAVLRTLLRVIEVNPFLAGGIPAGLVACFSKKGQRLGDMIADTYVAPVRTIDTYHFGPSDGMQKRTT